MKGIRSFPPRFRFATLANLSGQLVKVIEQEFWRAVETSGDVCATH